MNPLISVSPKASALSTGTREKNRATQSDGHRWPLPQRISRHVCWTGWVSALSVVLFVLLTSGCQSSEPVVPEDIYERVNNDGREWTYDTAWQNIRGLNADLERGDLATVSEDALFVVSQMERLETAKATAMTSPAIATLIEQLANEAAARTVDANVTAARVAAQRLQDAFDEGDFLTAKKAALEVYTISQRLSANE